MHNLTERAASPSLGAGNLAPGAWVRHRDCPEWGLGQVQSAVGSRVTVNFEHAGKVLVDTRHVDLDVVDP